MVREGKYEEPSSQLHLGTWKWVRGLKHINSNCICVSERKNCKYRIHLLTRYTFLPIISIFWFEGEGGDGVGGGVSLVLWPSSHFAELPPPIAGLRTFSGSPPLSSNFSIPIHFSSALFPINLMGRPKGDGARSKARPSSSRCLTSLPYIRWSPLSIIPLTAILLFLFMFPWEIQLFFCTQFGCVTSAIGFCC